MSSGAQLWRVATAAAARQPFVAACIVCPTSGIILRAAPILQRFQGQPLGSLVRWGQRQGFLIERIA